ncbi:FecCD family ABC transporter permease [Clostridium pasteurianum]|uniref:ABC-type Fe3+-siderophore transport system, permease component n=1 Tax=Clostridium pasteurianum BC1 TaxID=86416 RepID=R4K992_CLOPA|nr:iron ABC transporter permease [Clostridium pasteurianum]AGK98276.1 ABC-type Fe3+-siderophore transport system, permease component [Clostridium pasteurianum BC1]
MTNETTQAKKTFNTRELYNKIIRKRIYFIICSLMILLSFFTIDIMTGASLLSIKEVLYTIFFSSSSDYQTYVIVWIMRMPVAVMAVIVGASLSVAGAEMQTILDNPMATPYTLGISSAASFGAYLAIVIGKGIIPVREDLIIPINAFVFSLALSLLIYFIARVKKGTSETIILAGISFSFLFSSLASILNYIATEESRQKIIMWSYGSLSASKWSTVIIVFIVFIVTVPLLLVDSWKITSLKLGDSKAKSLGVNVERIRLKVLVIVSLIAATSVCFVGTIGFIGLAGPHIARSFVGEDHRYFIPCSALIGACILSISSVLSKVLVPGAIIDVGLITAIIGMPFLLSIVLRRKNY